LQLAAEVSEGKSEIVTCIFAAASLGLPNCEVLLRERRVVLLSLRRQRVNDHAVTVEAKTAPSADLAGIFERKFVAPAHRAE
jgi:hypothetical protein